MPYAGFVTRAVALVFDLLIVNAAVAVIAGIVGLILSGFSEHLNNDVGTFLAGASFWLLVVVVYFVTFWASVGQTPSMRLMGITVVSVHGRRITIRQAVRRLVGMALCAATLGLGYLPVLFNKRRQGLHDKLAGTLVLYEEADAKHLPIARAKRPARLAAPKTEEPIVTVIEPPHSDT